MSPSHRAFTLIELLVVIAIMAMLAALALAGVLAARESGRRTQCASNLQQLGMAMQSYRTTKEYFPTGADSKIWLVNRDLPRSFYRWSTLAHLTPYLELNELRRGLDMNVPLFIDTSGTVAPQNQECVRQVIAQFLCPSDGTPPVSADFGPTNYVFCSGDGSAGGVPINANGMFYINSQLQIRDIKDGQSSTMAISESTLGTGGDNASGTQSQFDYATTYAFIPVANLTDESCLGASQFNVMHQRGFSWANGEYRCTMYNAWRLPNSVLMDCIGTDAQTRNLNFMLVTYGWRPPRSMHREGVNVIMADGSGRYVNNDIALPVWRALSTRNVSDKLPAGY